jgi:DNA-binding response OmpR family regulator
MTARVKAVLKRIDSNIVAEKSKTYGELTLDIAGREVKIAQEKLDLSPKEFDLLVYLIKNSGRVLSRDQITENVWGYEFTAHLL